MGQTIFQTVGEVLWTNRSPLVRTIFIVVAIVLLILLVKSC